MSGQSGPRIYSGDGWEIRSGRWQDSPPAEVDAVISDPPYDKHTHKSGRRGVNGGHGKHESICSSAVKSFDALELQEIQEIVDLTAVAKRWVIAFCAVEQLGDYRRAAGAEYIRGGIWSRPAPAPQFTGDRPGQWGDGIAIMHRKGRKRWNGGGKPARWSVPHCGTSSAERGERFHETQKPIDLMIELVKLFTDPGDLVWDPYCGSATTGAACIRLGRRFIGHEMRPRILGSKSLPGGHRIWLEHPDDQPYARLAAERLAAEERGILLADARAGQTSIFDQIGAENGMVSGV